MDKDTRWLIAQEIPHLRRFARSLVHHPEKADDLVQDALERGLRKYRLWRPRKGSLRTWLFKILYNVHLNAYKKAARKNETALEAIPEGVFAQNATQDQKLMVQDTLHRLAQLPKEQRDALVLVALNDLPYAEAAKVLGVPLGTLRSRLARGRATMRDYANITKLHNEKTEKTLGVTAQTLQTKEGTVK